MVKIYIIFAMMVLGGAIEGGEEPPSKDSLRHVYSKAKNATLGRVKEAVQPVVDTIKDQPVVQKITKKIDCRRYCNSKSKCKNNPALAQDCKENCGQKTRCYIGFEEEQNKKLKALPPVPEAPKEIPAQTIENQAVNADVILEKILALPCKDRYQIINSMMASGVKEEDKLSKEEKNFLLGQCPPNPWQSSSPTRKNSENTVRRIMNQDHHIIQRQGTPSIKPTPLKPNLKKEIAPLEFSETPIAKSLTDLEPRENLSSFHEEMGWEAPNRLLEAQKALDRHDPLNDQQSNAQKQSAREKQLKEFFAKFEADYFPMIKNLGPDKSQNKQFWTNFLAKFDKDKQFPLVTAEDMMKEFQRLKEESN